MAISTLSLANRIVAQWQAQPTTQFASPPIPAEGLAGAMAWLQALATAIATGVVDEIGEGGIEGGGGGGGMAIGVLADLTATAPVTGQAADGASAVAVVVDNLVALANATAKILSIRNAGSEVAAVYANGKISVSSLGASGNVVAGGDLAVGGDGDFAGQLAAAGLNTAGAVSAASATFTGDIAAHEVHADAVVADSVSGGVGGFSGAVEAASLEASGAILGASLTATGQVSAGSLVSAGNATASAHLGLAGDSGILRGQAADGASAVGAAVDNSNSLAAAGAKLLAVRNNGAEKLAVSHAGRVQSALGDSLHLAGRQANSNTAVGIILEASTEGSFTDAASKPVSIRNGGAEIAYFGRDGTLFGPGLATAGPLTAEAIRASGIAGHILGAATRAIWRLDETSGTATAAEVRGVYPLTTVTGTPTVVAGKFRNARYFEGASWARGPADSASVAKVKAEGWTVGGWVRLINPNVNQTFFALAHSDGTASPFYVGMKTADKRVYMGSSSAGDATVSGSLTLTAVLSLWSHICVVRTGGQYRLYINGISYGVVTVANSTDTPATPSWLIANGPLGICRAELEDWWFEDKVLTAEEVVAEYLQGFALSSQRDARVTGALQLGGDAATNVAIVMPIGQGISFTGRGAQDLYHDGTFLRVTQRLATTFGAEFEAGGGIQAISGQVLAVKGRIANGASAVAVTIDNLVNLTTAGAKILSITNASVEKAYIDKDGKLSTPAVLLPSTDSSGTPGAATANTASGRAAIAAGTSSVVVANSLVTAASRIFVQKTGSSFDATLTAALQVAAGAGSFTVYGNAAATADVPFNWWVLP